MKRELLFIAVVSATLSLSLLSCNQNNAAADNQTMTDQSAGDAGQSAVEDDESQKDIVKVAAGSKDHTTLVTAVKTAEYVDVLSNSGPFTVFAPTNEAFNKLPQGTVDNLLKPEKKNDLRNILEYHVSIGVFKQESLRDGQILGQANGDNVTIGMKDGKFTVNGANILATVPASNGIVYVTDGVLLPPAKP